ncbi:hypothetical protein SDC9_164880 [bioreactor metagenome]|uniref:Uncharacterized protein n=1 Tax=bioreactor metagenome TaxID=1076179 RepID=A0A645FUQ9_9ZZZZ
MNVTRDKTIDGLPRLCEDFARDGVHNRLRRDVVANPRADGEFFVEFIAPDARQIITLVEEQRI